MPSRESDGPVPARIGRYRVLDRIGAGGLAEVFRASRGDGSGLVAIKRLRAKWHRRPDLHDMFATEADVGRRLVDRNIVRTHEIGFDADGRLFIVMEYVAGRSLRDVIERLGQQQLLAHELSIHLICEVLSGLHSAHELRSATGAPLHLIHRDVSPDNLLLSFDGEVKLSDFGVAHLEGLEGEQGKREAFGKVPFMAPEQLERRDIDRRIDVYAVGVILYELLTGEHPYRRGPADRDEDLVHRIVRGKHVRAAKLLPAIPESLDAVIEKALALRPEERFRSALEMQGALEGFVRTHEGWATVIAGTLRYLFAAEYGAHVQAAAVVGAAASRPGSALSCRR